jgi:hypothetical protein
MSVKKTGMLLCTLQQRSFRIFEEETENPKKYKNTRQCVFLPATQNFLPPTHRHTGDNFCFGGGTFAIYRMIAAGYGGE